MGDGPSMMAIWSVDIHIILCDKRAQWEKGKAWRAEWTKWSKRISLRSTIISMWKWVCVCHYIESHRSRISVVWECFLFDPASHVFSVNEALKRMRAFFSSCFCIHFWSVTRWFSSCSYTDRNTCTGSQFHTFELTSVR